MISFIRVSTAITLLLSSVPLAYGSSVRAVPVIEKSLADDVDANNVLDTSCALRTFAEDYTGAKCITFEDGDDRTCYSCSFILLEDTICVNEDQQAIIMKYGGDFGVSCSNTTVTPGTYYDDKEETEDEAILNIS
eukprot:CAMPEP_0197823264 /NCGR_PEP_ID=MMETSP1437-20131217/582_1 /TAXON_ID=49252 ORGANISM="Eucampia antarctica, Strain CCMP1452" /NCGR_SAMPLE_ID=MMETSP1437 /ASSEMBLY_ACC=CAM_ASM_001096 /LENGTH=134 /DNA_ID=CAMNT_0043422321 /DNA_START=77 /DNA_END=481 /DNA_ORIENTATION=-